MKTTPRETELTDRLEKMERTVAALTAQLETALAENQRLTTENKLLREKVDKLVRKIFGKSSESERSGDRQPQAARWAEAKPKSKTGCRAAGAAAPVPRRGDRFGKIARLPVHQPRR